MRDEYWLNLEQCLSTERLEPYQADGACRIEVTARYLWNVALSESLYAPLHFCEIALRNSIHTCLQAHTMREDWYETLELTSWAKEQIQKAKRELRQSKKPIEPGRVVAELNFGFWTSLFEQDYEGRSASFLPKGIKRAFPLMPKSHHKRKAIKGRLDKIRKLRNRVSHHERIIHWKDLESQHAMIIETIGWIDPDVLHMVQVTDRFASVYQSGTQPYVDRVKSNGLIMVGSDS